MCLLYGTYICKKEYTTSGNTSNLKDHIKQKHPEEFGRNGDDNLRKKKKNSVLYSKSQLLMGKVVAREKFWTPKLR